MVIAGDASHGPGRSAGELASLAGALASGDTAAVLAALPQAASSAINSKYTGTSTNFLIIFLSV